MKNYQKAKNLNNISNIGTNNINPQMNRHTSHEPHYVNQ
jgi:hypothetical protein